MLKTSKLLFSFLSTTDDAEFASFKSSTSNVPRPSSLNDFRTIEGYVTSEINPDYIEELKITAEKNKEVSGLFDELKQNYRKIRKEMDSLAVLFQNASYIFKSIKEVVAIMNEVIG